jgi:hypothetical protein
MRSQAQRCLDFIQLARFRIARIVFLRRLVEVLIRVLMSVVHF